MLDNCDKPWENLKTNSFVKTGGKSASAGGGGGGVLALVNDKNIITKEMQNKKCLV